MYTKLQNPKGACSVLPKACPDKHENTIYSIEPKHKFTRMCISMDESDSDSGLSDGM